MRRRAGLLLALLFLSAAAPPLSLQPAVPAPPLRPAAPAALAGGRAPDKVLTGHIDQRDFRHYRAVPFAFPEGADRLLVEASVDHQPERTVIDIGLEDPRRFRGASGSNKQVILVGESEATPSYLPGAMPPGRWQLLIAVPNIRDGVTATWTARLWFLRPGEPDTPPPTSGRGPGWYRGDLHVHTSHSDGSCAPQSGVGKVPCPVWLTFATAAARGLDFISVTEHNTTSHYAALRELQPYFDRMLLIPGREITTFFGHFNIHGVTAPIDFRIQLGGPVTFNGIADRVHALGGIVVVNHPALPSDERCMGCGWTMPAVDPARVDAVETVNGSSLGAVEPQFARFVDGTPFWLDWTKRNGSVAALGASDNHMGSDRSERPGTVGRPTTVVHADDLTQPAILAGIRAGRLFIDTEGVAGRHLDFALLAGEARTPMGGRTETTTGPVQIAAEVDAPAGTILRLLDGDATLLDTQLSGGRQALALPLTLAPGGHVLRLVVLRADQPILVSNATVADAAGRP